MVLVGRDPDGSFGVDLNSLDRFHLEVRHACPGVV